MVICVARPSKPHLQLTTCSLLMCATRAQYRYKCYIMYVLYACTDTYIDQQARGMYSMFFMDLVIATIIIGWYSCSGLITHPLPLYYYHILVWKRTPTMISYQYQQKKKKVPTPGTQNFFALKAQTVTTAPHSHNINTTKKGSLIGQYILDASEIHNTRGTLYVSL